MKIIYRPTNYGHEVDFYHSPAEEKPYRRFTTLYFSHQDVDAHVHAPRRSWAHLDDGYRQILVSSYCLISLDVSDLRDDAAFTNGSGFRVDLDTTKFLQTLRALRAKFPPQADKRRSFPMDSSRFSPPRCEVRLLGFSEIVRHENGKELTHTLLTFLRELPRTLWENLRKDLSAYLTRARVYGYHTGREFYFDGRRIPGGCGFNGGIILRDQEYSIHT